MCIFNKPTGSGTVIFTLSDEVVSSFVATDISLLGLDIGNVSVVVDVIGVNVVGFIIVDDVDGDIVGSEDGLNVGPIVGIDVVGGVEDGDAEVGGDEVGGVVVVLIGDGVVAT